MIRRSVRKRFHTVHWIPPKVNLETPCIFVPNHHGWFDGYLMFHVIKTLGIPTLDWIQEFDAFPLFAKIGGMPYPLNDLKRRSATVKRTIRLMKEDNWSLLLFAEAHLHPPPTLLEFGRALEVIAEKVPNAQVIPVGIKYELSLHERPEAFILLGEPVEGGEKIAERTRDEVQHLLDRIPNERDNFEILVKGTLDVNERWDMRRFKS